MRGPWVLVAIAALVACAQIGPPMDWLHENPAIPQLAVQVATLKLVERDPAKAQRILELVDRAEASLESGPISLDDLETQIRQTIRWDRLEPSDQLLVSALILQARTELERRLPEDAGEIPPAIAPDVRAVLGWIREAALLVAGPTGP